MANSMATMQGCCCETGVTVCSEWRQFFDDRGWDNTQGDAELTISGSVVPALDGTWLLPKKLGGGTNFISYAYPATGSEQFRVTLACGGTIFGLTPNDWAITGQAFGYGPLVSQAVQNAYFFPSNLSSIINSPVTLAPYDEDPGAVWTVTFP